MAINKSALTRYKILDSCFRNPGRRYYIQNLIDECNNKLLEIDASCGGISRRQIFSDMTFMESSEGWSIELIREKDEGGKRVFYHYADMSYSINDMPLNEMEIFQLKEAIEILSQFKGMPQFDWMNELLPKLQQGAMQSTEQKQIISFDNNAYLKGIEHLGELYNAILYNKVLSINYHPFDKPNAVSYTIHSYFLKQYNNRWFLFCKAADQALEIMTLALDRIVSIHENNKVKYIASDIDWDEYFDDIIGVSKAMNAEPQQIVLQFLGNTGHYIETKPLHGSQKSKWLNATTFEIRLKIIPNNEFYSLLCSYSGAFKVIEPDEVKNQVIAMLTREIDLLKG